MDYNKVQPLGETYTCLQGEGKYIGIPHILIRVTGCRLRCQFSNSFCDTPYASWKPEKGKYTLNDIVDNDTVLVIEKNLKAILNLDIPEIPNWPDIKAEVADKAGKASFAISPLGIPFVAGRKGAQLAGQEEAFDEAVKILKGFLP